MGQAYLFGNENGASDSIRDSVVTHLLQDSYQETTRLLSRNYKTFIKNLQDLINRL